MLWMTTQIIEEIFKLPKQPKYFAVKTPVLDKKGELQVIKRDDKEEYKSEKDVSQYTCYHDAHQSGWKTHFVQLQHNLRYILIQLLHFT